MIRLSAAVALLAASLSLSACGFGPGPHRVGGTQTGVSLRYDATELSIERVTESAQSYCESYDKDAKLRSRSSIRPEETYADFACVTPASPAPATNTGK